MAIVTNKQIDRSIGSLEARMDSTEKRLERMEDKIDTLVEVIATSKGSIKTLLTLGSVIAGVAAAATEVLHWLFSRHS